MKIKRSGKIRLKKCSALKKIVNYSAKLIKLDTCCGNKTWYVKGKKASKLASGKTAISKGKKFKISYHLLGGKKKETCPPAIDMEVAKN